MASRRNRASLAFLFSSALVAGLFAVGVAQAEGDGHDHSAHGKDAHGDSGHDAHGDDAHGDGHHEINWFYGFLAESDEYEQNILWRDPGTPAPLGATLLNTAILLFIFVRVGKKPLTEGLKKRKATVMKGIDDASKMKAEAEEQLAKYEAKLEKITEEVSKLKQQLVEAAEIDREQSLADAKQRRERMERDARVLVEQELKAVRDRLVKSTADEVLNKATTLVEKNVTAQDHERVAESYLEGIQTAFGHLKGARS